MVTRRHVLKLPLAVGLGGKLLGGCGGDNLDPDDIIAATFEVSETEAIVSVHVPEQVTAVLRIEDGVTGAQALYGPLDVAAEDGHTGFFDVRGLDPDRDYRYRIEVGGVVTAWFAFRTAPPAGQAQPFRFVFSADIDPSDEWDSPIFDSMMGSGSAFFLCLGDWPYADSPDLDLLRERHEAARACPKVQRLLRSMPAYAIWDDHEVVNNWDRERAERAPEWIANAVRVWDEWFPLRDRSQTKTRYRTWRWGSLAQVFVLDTRFYRDANTATDDANKTMLGTEQRQWLERELAASTAAFKVIATSVPLDFGDSIDSWFGFQTERDALFAFLAAEQITGVLFVSADHHWFAAHHFDNGVRELQVGPLARGFPLAAELPSQAPQVVARHLGYNYGELQFSPGTPAQAVFVCRGPEGEELYREVFAADMVVTAT